MAISAQEINEEQRYERRLRLAQGVILAIFRRINEPAATLFSDIMHQHITKLFGSSNYSDLRLGNQALWEQFQAKLPAGEIANKLPIPRPNLAKPGDLRPKTPLHRLAVIMASGVTPE